MKLYLQRLAAHPLGVLYAVFTGIIAIIASVPLFASGAVGAALVDLAMASILIALMMKRIFSTPRRNSALWEKCAAWLLLISADVLALLPTHNFAGSITTAFAFSLLICALVLYIGGARTALACTVPVLWCCVFMPYHEEIMLLLSFPLRLSATVFSAAILNLSGCSVVHSGTSLTLPGVDIAITDACSGINQLDAFILIAFIAVQMLHRRNGWKLLHFAFIIPAIIAGNSLRIVLTVALYRMLGDRVFGDIWHTALGYTQIIFAMLLFLGIGSIFSLADRKTEEEQS
ncbi:MAG: exosortase/archaeosortase family protein [Victivallales bacterium]|nr:exosortase/archaeosortase family protein [Victivallales bacterium]